MKILVINSGSSSLKYQLFDMADNRVLARATMERIGEAGGAPDHAAALAEVVQQLRRNSDMLDGIAAVGHRVVHGGEKFVQAVLIDDDVEAAIESLIPLAPLHNPPNLTGIRAAKEYFPDVPHVAVFDTSFHQTMPAKAYLYAIRYDLYEKNRIRRYGFHGTSHRYVAQRAATILGMEHDEFTGITAHLGNGCSLAAVQNGHSVDTSMGLTPLEGVPMGTRSGDIDPAIIFHLAERLNLTVEDINRLLNRESGLKGVSGLTNDLREVEKAAEEGHERARLAVDVYGYRVRKYIGAYLSVLRNPQAVVFTGGVGENGIAMRHRILEELDHVGIVLDDKKNAGVRGKEGIVTADDSPVKVLVVPTNEELMIARDTKTVAEETLAPG